MKTPQLSGSSLCFYIQMNKETGQGWWEKATVHVSWTHHQYLHSALRKALPFLRASPEDSFATLMGWGVGVLDMANLIPGWARGCRTWALMETLRHTPSGLRLFSVLARRLCFQRAPGLFCSSSYLGNGVSSWLESLWLSTWQHCHVCCLSRIGAARLAV